LKARTSDPDRYLYRLLNRIFLVIPVLVVLYALLFSPQKQRHPIPSGSLLFSDKSTISTGLSRSFSAAVRLDFESAESYNPFGIRIFLFFLIQLLMRLLALILVMHVPNQVLRGMFWSDAIISVTLFLISFWPFLSDLSTSFLNS
jgi:hypothetical protein